MRTTWVGLVVLLGCGVDVGGLGLEPATVAPTVDEASVVPDPPALEASAPEPEPTEEAAAPSSVNAAIPDAGCDGCGVLGRINPTLAGMVACGVTDAAVCGRIVACGISCMNSNPAFPNSVCCPP